jgi:deazaflavin-dependent oxidoreductase (nitroreductase family)
MAKGNLAVRKFNKAVTNPILGALAGKKYFYASLVKHTGRRSGKTYATPVLVKKIADGFAFVLPYGTDVDWYRNILASRRCDLLSQGKEYSLVNPKPVETRTGFAYYGKIYSIIFKALRIAHFFTMEINSD